MPVCPKCNTTYSGTLKYCSLDGTSLISCSDEVYLSIGEIINESLSVVSRLRTDRLGVVYQLADKIVTGRASCLRLFHPGVAARSTFRELDHLGTALRDGLEGSDIVTNYIVIDLDNGTQGLISDFCTGESFDTILAREAPMAAKQVVSILLQLAEILNGAHASGFIHGGLSPDNIIVTGPNSKELSAWPKSSQFKLIDFAIARTVLANNTRGLNQFTGELQTPNYATCYAPELFTGDREIVDARIDVYSLGALCYQMLSGRSPFTSDSAEKPTYITDDPRKLLMLAPELQVPRALETLMLKALSRDMEARQESLAQLIEELQEIYFDLSVLGPSITAPSRAPSGQYKAPTSQLSEQERAQTGLFPDHEAAAGAIPPPPPPPLTAREHASAREREKASTSKFVESSDELPLIPPGQAPANKVATEPPANQPVTPPPLIKSLPPPPPPPPRPAATHEANILLPGLGQTGTIKPYTNSINVEMTPLTGAPMTNYKALPTRPIKRRMPISRWLLLGSAGIALLLVTSILLVLVFQPAVGSLIITSSPSGAQIWLDGRIIGQAPAKLEDVPAGPHRIRLTKEGFIAAERDVLIVKKQTLTLPLLTLAPDRPPVDIAGTPEERVKEFTRLAEEAYARGDYVMPDNNNALYFNNAVLAINPNDAAAMELRTRIKDALYKQAEAAQQKSDIASAELAYSQIIERFPEETRAADTLKRIQGQLELRRGQLNQLLQQSEAAFNSGRLVEPPGNNALYFANQALAIERGNQTAIRLRGRVKESLLQEAEQLNARNDLRGAVEKYERVARYFPEDRRITGQIRQLNDQIAQQAVKSNDPKKHRDVGLQKYGAGDYASAANELEQAVKNGINDSDTLYHLGAANWKRGRNGEARVYLNQVLDQNPNHGAALAVLGQIAETRRETGSAISYYERAVRAGGSSEFSLAFVKERLESLKTESRPKERGPEPYSAQVVHEHTIGSCRGTVEVNAQGVRYSSSNDHSFAVSLSGISELKLSSDQISLKAGEKKYTFKFPDKTPQRFQQAYYDFFRAGSSR